MESLINPAALSLIPLITALVQVAKQSGLSSKYAPYLSISLGIILSTLVVPETKDIILGGLVLGLSASGLYSGTKTALK